MCYSCWIAEGSPNIQNDKVLECAKLLEGIDDYGNCHIIVSDWNVRDSDIEACLKFTEEDKDETEQGKEENKNFLNKFKELSEAERYTALAIRNQFI